MHRATQGPLKILRARHELGWELKNTLFWEKSKAALKNSSRLQSCTLPPSKMSRMIHITQILRNKYIVYVVSKGRSCRRISRIWVYTKKVLSIQGAFLYPVLPYIYHPETGEAWRMLNEATSYIQAIRSKHFSMENSVLVGTTTLCGP